MFSEVVKNGTIIACKHGSFPLAKMEDLLLGLYKILDRYSRYLRTSTYVQK